MSISVRRQFVTRLNEVPVDSGLPDVEAIKDELLGMTSVLLGREDAPIDAGVMTRMEVALAYYARACEIEMLILGQEHEGNIVKGSPYYLLRTGQLRRFIEMSKVVVQAGSRSLTHEMYLQRLQEAQE